MLKTFFDMKRACNKSNANSSDPENQNQLLILWISLAWS